MADRSAFIQAILDTPDDDAPRLVFADWLTDHTEADCHRAEFIRVQCEIARLPAGHPRRAELQLHEVKLLRDHGRSFSPHPLFQDDLFLQQSYDRWHGLSQGELPWHRGFPRWAQLSAEKFSTQIENILKDEAVFDIELQFYGFGSTPADRVEKWIGPFCANPRLALVGTLDLCDTLFCDPPERFVQLIQSPHLTGLKEVAVFKEFIGVRGIRALIESPSPFRLRALMLGCFIEPHYAEVGQVEDFLESVRLIAYSPRLASLEALSLDSYYDAEGRGEEVAQVLLSSPTLSPSLALHFDSLHELAPATRDALAQRFKLVVRED